jgi:6-pyruvoyltetrahydropterin/6-carboxytetrahydropterin synthase
MTKIRAVRRLQFCAGHRVMGHENKCAKPHGHNYVVYLHAAAESLDNVGRVIDFSVLKERVGTWIDQYWDHCFIVHERDTQLIQALRSFSGLAFMRDNPTAENMARFLLEDVCPRVLKGTGVTVERVVLWETENCFAEVELA